MDRVVGAIAAEDLVGDGNRTVGGHIEPEDQLLEVRPMVLAQPVGDLGIGVRALVASVERDARGVVVDPARIEFELLDDVEGQAEEQTACPG